MVPGSAIYSVDFHPSGTKLATGGQKSDQGGDLGMGMIAVWELDATVEHLLPKAHNALAKIIHESRWERLGYHPS